MSAEGAEERGERQHLVDPRRAMEDGEDIIDPRRGRRTGEGAHKGRPCGEGGGAGILARYWHGDSRVWHKKYTSLV